MKFISAAGTARHLIAKRWPFAFHLSLAIVLVVGLNGCGFTALSHSLVKRRANPIELTRLCTDEGMFFAQYQYDAKCLDACSTDEPTCKFASGWQLYTVVEGNQRRLSEGQSIATAGNLDKCIDIPFTAVTVATSSSTATLRDELIAFPVNTWKDINTITLLVRGKSGWERRVIKNRRWACTQPYAWWSRPLYFLLLPITVPLDIATFPFQILMGDPAEFAIAELYAKYTQ